MSTTNTATQLQDIDGRVRRIETRLTRFMMAYAVDPGKSYNLADSPITVDRNYREVVIPHMNVSLLDMSNTVQAEGGNLNEAWTIVFNGRNVGTLSFAR